MISIKNIKNFLRDQNAISEEYTTLPALSVVMIGFTIFFLLLTNTYNAYETRIDSLEKYKTADFIITKITNPDCFFIKEGGIIYLNLLSSSESIEILNNIRNEYLNRGIDFVLRLNWKDNYKDFPNKIPKNVENHIAVSKQFGICLNEAQTKPGTLTIIIWEVF